MLLGPGPAQPSPAQQQTMMMESVSADLETNGLGAAEARDTGEILDCVVTVNYNMEPVRGGGGSTLASE